MHRFPIPRVRLVACALALLIPGVSRAQPVTGSGSGRLTERSHYVAFFRAPPANTPDLVLILRGQPQWATTPQGSSSRGRSTVGPEGSGGHRPISMRMTFGDVHFECSYDASVRVLHYQGQAHTLGSANVVIIDQIDRVGGPPRIVRRFYTPFPTVADRLAFPKALRGTAELQEFLR